MGKYEYDYPMAALTADAVVIKFVGDEDNPHILLIKRNTEPFKGKYALPGGYFEAETDTDLEHTARRELFEEVGLEVDKMYQVGTYSKIGRDPRGRTVTTAFYVELFDHLDDEEVVLDINKDEVQRVKWVPMNSCLVGDMAFDHADIVKDAISLLSY